MWPRCINVALGLWLMAAPAFVPYGKAAEINDRIVGPLVVTFAIIAIAECTRPVRWANFALGLWMIMVPILLDYRFEMALHSIGVGVLIVAASLIRGVIRGRHGGGWAVLGSGTQVRRGVQDSGS